MDVLVTYASAHGSTAGVSERIGEVLRATGHQVEVRPVKDVDDATRFAALVVGSAIHNGKWLSEAADFVSDNRDTLASRPVWLFSVSSLGDRSGAFAEPVNRRLRAMRKEPKQMTEIRTAIRARGHRNFTGAIDPSHWSAPGRLLFRVFGGRFGDHRDWPDIDGWAREIGKALAGE